MHGRTPCVGAQALGFKCSISYKVVVTVHLNELGEPAMLIGAVKSEIPLILPYIDGFPTARIERAWSLKLHHSMREISSHGSRLKPGKKDAFYEHLTRGTGRPPLN